MAREIAGYFGGARHDSELPSATARRSHRRLRIEPLEVRSLMDATGLAALVTATWFQTVSSDTTEHAGAATWTTEDTIVSSTESSASDTTTNVYDWIIQFDTAKLSGISTVAQTASLLVGSGVEFEVIKGLGLAGMVLVRSSGASLGTVESCLNSNTYVSSFEQDAVREEDVSSNDSQAASEWALAAIDATNAWGITTGSSSVVVAVIDTGVDYTHVDLAANMWTNSGEIAGNGIDDDGDGFIDDVYGYNFFSDTGDAKDDNGHGTHVAGTIGAVGNNGTGVTGVNWSVSIMSLKFMSSNGSGYLSDAIEAMNYATMMRTTYGVNVRVANCSWGGSSFSSAMETAIQAANDAGILVVVAAGNSSSNNDATAQYPANYDNVISVAASTKTNTLASFSNYGSTTVDIAAPGVSIYSTVLNNSYAYYSGTSMAAPQVSAVAALCWAANPDATVAEVRAAILNGVTKVSSLSGKVASGGVLDAYATLELITADLPTISTLTVSSSSVTVGTKVTLSAKGITDSLGKVNQVLFYRDSNGNGMWDSSDTLVASTSTISNGTAKATVSTTGLASGTYQYFARAVDNYSRVSAAASVTLIVKTADDFGNTAATASAVAVSSSVSGKLEKTGDTDWFAFQATAGKKYILSTTLSTLKDSVLYLYGSNGKTKLAYNDDYGTSTASRISWTATSSGTYYVVVGGYGGKLTGTYVLTVQMAGSTTSKTSSLGLDGGDAVPLVLSVTSTAEDTLSREWDRLQSGWSQDAACELHDAAFADRQRSSLPGGRRDTAGVGYAALAESLSGLLSVDRRPYDLLDDSDDAMTLMSDRPPWSTAEQSVVDAVFAAGGVDTQPAAAFVAEQ